MEWDTPHHTAHRGGSRGAPIWRGRGGEGEDTVKNTENKLFVIRTISIYNSYYKFESKFFQNAQNLNQIELQSTECTLSVHI